MAGAGGVGGAVEAESLTLAAVLALGAVWVAGQVNQGRHDTVAAACAFPGPDCWGEVLSQETPEPSWWVEIRYQGRTEWVKPGGDVHGS